MKKFIIALIAFILTSQLTFADRYYYEERDGQMYWDDLPVGYNEPWDQVEVDKKGVVVDLDSFVVINDRSTYAKDKNHIYSTWSIIDSADITSFEVIEPNDDYRLGLVDMGYAKDKNNVYKNGNILKDADPETFRVMPNYSADKNYIYNNESKEVDLEELDAATFLVSPDGNLSDKNGFYEINNGEVEKINEESLFPDVHPADEIYEKLEKANSQGWITGYPDGTVRLNDPVNRAEFAKMLTIAFTKGVGNGGNLQKFPDVYFDQWYVPYLSKAVELGSMSGYPDGKMRPGNNINRAEALKMALELVQIPFIEVPANSPWYEKYRKHAINDGYDLDFLDVEDMSEDMTRGECVELILEALEDLGPG